VASRSISSKESTTIRPTPTSSARLSSATDLLLPCITSRAAGTPADQGDVQLATRRDVQPHALFVGQTGHGRAQRKALVA
jgi:hypothetical protein